MNKLPAILLSLLLLASCSKAPGYVISQDKMARVMADVYMGDAVVENAPRDWNNDSLRQVFLQSIYAKHGVTAEQVDTSLIWYGHNIQAYMDMCTQAEEILQKRIEEAERQGGKIDRNVRTTSIDGDSVDVWPGVKNRRNMANMPSEYLTFALSSDRNWDRGDRYTLSVKGLNTRRPVVLNVAVDYNDGTSEYTTLSAPAENMNRLLLVLDSAKVATSVYGMIHYSPAMDEISYLDSITLVRTRGRNDNVKAREGQTVMTYKTK